MNVTTRMSSFSNATCWNRLGIVCLALLLVSLGAAPAWAQALRMAPVNPAFQDYLDDVQAQNLRRDLSDGRVLGVVPSPVLLPEVEVAPPADWPILRFTTSYDLRDENKLTSIRNQLECGACWTFATYAAFESYLMPGENRDFSENHMKNTHGFDNGPCDGGHIQMSSAYLTRWGGPVNESDDPYHDWDDRPSPGGTVQKHVYEIQWLPDRTGSQDNDAIKSALVNYGAVMTSMRWEDDSYDFSTSSYYYSGSDVGNHGVAIVGWDDNYSRTKFSPSAPGNGAFLIRNSWGTDFGDGGYFYISYYDSIVGSNCAVYFDDIDGEDPGYDTIYQYDPLGMASSIGYGSETAWGGNVFTAQRDEIVGGVGFYLPSAGSSYTVRVYTSVGSNPSSGTLAASHSGSQTYAGYYTVDFSDDNISVTSGTKFSAVVQLTTPGNNYPVPLELFVSEYSSGASANANESWISYNGTSWTDITTVYPTANVTIKAYTFEPAEEAQCNVCDDASNACPSGYECVQYTSGGGERFCVKNCTQGESCPNGSTCVQALENASVCVPDITGSQCENDDAMYTDSCGREYVGEDCDDEIACTTDACVVEDYATCSHQTNDTLCQDGLYCNGEEICDVTEGCQAGEHLNYDDGIVCTIDACAEGSDVTDNMGIISHEPDSDTCQDGLFCNGEEVCDETQGCQAGTPPSTEDDDVCTEGVCLEGDDLTDNLGTIEQQSSAAACQDGLFCNGMETCDPVQGCQAGTPPNLSDGIPCTADACNEGPDDSDDVGFITHDPDPTSCQDGLFCNGEEVCNETQGCQAGTPPDLGDGVSCTVDTCHEGSDTTDNYGMVLHHEDASLCQDGLFCNGEEVCDATNDCQAGTPPSTEDGDLCTEGVCLEGDNLTDNLGTIEQRSSAASCQDGLFCNGEETCDPVQGCQAGTPPDLSDGIPCTTDTCNEGANVHDNAGNILHEPNASLCQDGLFCNGEEVCNETQGCQAGPPPDLDDGVFCTVDTCREGADETDNYGMVLHYEDASRCQDGLFCNGEEVCDETQGCQAGTPPYLDDSIACTQDLCAEGEDVTDNAGTILHRPQDAQCNDTACAAGVCDPSQGCTLEPIEDGTICLTPTNVAGTCLSGQCVSDCTNNADCDDGLPCTTDACDTTRGKCSNQPDDAYCDDDNVCTQEVCDTTLGCRYTNVEGSCEDGLICTVDDTCIQGECLSGRPMDCSGQCLSGTCSETEGGCTGDPAPDGTSCDDENLCTINDECNGGNCQGTAIVCDDSNACTEDYCSPVQGCVHEDWLDWTACTLAGEVFANCFAGQCEARAANDRCPQAVEIELGESETVEVRRMHPTYSYDLSCYPILLQGSDAYFILDTEEGWNYSVDVFSDDDHLALAAVAWTDCPQENDCPFAVDYRPAGGDILWDHLEGTGESYILQVIVTEDDGASEGAEITVSFDGEEIPQPDGDEEFEEEAEEEIEENGGDEDVADRDIWEEDLSDEDIWDDEGGDPDDELDVVDWDDATGEESELVDDEGLDAEEEFAEIDATDEAEKSDWYYESSEIPGSATETPEALEETRFSGGVSACAGAPDGSLPWLAFVLLTLVLVRRKHNWER